MAAVERNKMTRYELHFGDCRDVMRSMHADSIDSIVSDPPYGLSFMGKGWDHGVPSVEFWTEAFRVAKPGAHLLAFGGTRTFHRLAVAIEDAGWEIRDTVMWVYGSGFPKSHNISKGIDKAAGAEREVVGQKITGNARTDEGWSGGQILVDETAPATAMAKQWDGWGTALKPAFEPIIVARKPLGEKTVAANVLKHGTGAINVDGCRVGTTVETWPSSRSYAPGQMQPGHSGDTQPTGKTPQGRWPANLIHDGSDEVVALFPSSTNVSKGVRGRGGEIFANGKGFANTLAEVGQEVGYGDSGSAARFFYCAKASKRDRNEGLDGFEVRRSSGYGYDYGLGNAGEGMFKDRNPIKANHHPTVKPTALMRYLVRLVTPPNGMVLDPFMGSGSTGKAAMLEGFRFEGIDITPEYLDIARARIENALQKNNGDLFNGST